MILKQLKPYKSAPRDEYIPLSERSSITPSMFEPGMDLSKHIKGSHLTFLGIVENPDVERVSKSRKKVGKFKCNLCGNVIERYMIDIARGSIRSCGCLGKYEEIKPGERYGYLTVLDEEPNVKYVPYKHPNGSTYSQRVVKLPVQCDCGNKKYVTPRDLRTGSATTCAKCYHPSIPDSYKPELHRTCRLLGKRYDKIRSRTVNPDNDTTWVNYALRNIKLEMTLHDFIRAYYKQDIDFENMQVDRIDGNKSYSLDNIRWVSPKENMQNVIKPDSYTKLTVSYRLFTDGKFKRICDINGWVYDHFIKIEFPFLSSSNATYNLYVDKFGNIDPVVMVYYYIDIAKSVSDNMTAVDAVRKYLRLIDRDGKDVDSMSSWDPSYRVITNNP